MKSNLDEQISELWVSLHNKSGEGKDSILHKATVLYKLLFNAIKFTAHVYFTLRCPTKL